MFQAVVDMASILFQEIFPPLAGILGLLSTVSAVWLLVVGEWRFVILGITVAVIFPYVETIAWLPSVGLTFLGTALRKRVFILGFVLALLAIFYQQTIMVIWSFVVVSVATSYSNHYILLVVFGLSVVMGPLTYMARNDNGLGTVIGLLVALMSYVLFAASYLIGRGTAIFLLLLILFLFATIGIQGRAVYTTLKAEIA